MRLTTTSTGWLYHDGHTCDAARVLPTSAKGCRLPTAVALLGPARTLRLAVARSRLALGLRQRLPPARLAAVLVLPPARDCAGAAVAACKQNHAMYVSTESAPKLKSH